MVVGESKRANIMDGIENTGDVRMHDHRLRLKQRFDIVRKLGQGTYGKVQLGINKKTGQEVAIKTIKKCKIESEADLIRIRREVQIMSSVRHPNIVHIYEVFENSEKMILVMEYCSGGELYDYLSQKKVLQEDEARRLFRQIATAVYYCHIHKICHRDLKLENVLLDDTGSAKIADFGLSNVFKETSLLSTFCGSPLYASPEIVKGTPYIGPEVDCWSLGVLLYTLVYGAMPFDGSNFKRLVRQISNGDYYEPRNPSSASPLIRDMLTVDPLKRADIAYICDHPWVNTGCETSCLEMAEALAAETPVRLDLLLSLAPAANNSNSVVVPPEADLGPEESCTDLTSSASMAIEPSNSAEKRILELVAEGGEDAIKPSPTRTIVSAGDNKRKLELAMSASGLQRKKDRVASAASMSSSRAAVPEECAAEPHAEPRTEPHAEPSAEPPLTPDTTIKPSLQSSATMTIAPAPVELAKDATKEIVKEAPKDEEPKEKTGAKPRVTVKKKLSPTKTVEEKPTTPDKQEEVKPEDVKASAVAAAADKLTSLSIAQPPANQTPTKPKKLSIPGGNVGSFKDQFERRASLTTAPEIKRNISKPVVSKIAKPKAQSEDRELPAKTPDHGTVRLQQIGIEPAQTPTEPEHHPGGVKKTESEPTHGATPVDPSVLLQDARRSLQNSMAKLVEEKAGEESRRRAARDIISSAIRTGKPPVPYGRSSSAGVAALVSPPGSPGAPPAAPHAAPHSAPRLFRTEALHRVEDHRNRGVSVERIIPIHVAPEEPGAAPSPTPTPTAAPPKPAFTPSPAPRAPAAHAPLRRLASSESTASETCSSPGDPIKKSAREFIIPIAVEGKGYVTPRQRSLEPDPSSTHSLAHAHAPAHAPAHRHVRAPRAGRLRSPAGFSLVSGGESEEEDESHMHRLRSSRAARAESVSSGEDDEEDEGFHLLTAENLFSTLLHRVRALTNRLNGEEGPGFPQHPHSLFNNLHQSPFFNSPHLPRRHLLREGWGSRELHADFDSMFNKSRQQLPRDPLSHLKAKATVQNALRKLTERNY
ncbi:MAP/microtubule affinity-regulating kinase 3 isoform X3 [Manduca sexta]|uniref:MAP/microtubule affinity-regulating kinase 3 isoform X3 n=1 Tax=Manduca sexta TaxID=7130 RepID=UPI00188F5F99|nr:MAP/microtubule affinity-regulating kinase 3 isoform X3 [Manduca sexta]